MGAKLALGLAILGLSSVLTQNSASAAQLVLDKASGCKIVDEEAAPDRIARWKGPCAAGVAEGTGTAEFLAGDVLLRRVEASFSKGVAIGPIKVTRYKNGAITTVTEFSRGNGADETLQKIAFYREGAVSSVETGQWSGGKLNGPCTVDRFNGGALVKSYSGTCVNGVPAGTAKVRLYATSPSHDLIYEGTYVAGKLDGQGQSSEVLTAAPTKPAEACLKEGDVTWHYDGGWKANAMNGPGTIESHFCVTMEGAVHHVDMKATGSWIDGAQDGEALAEFATDGAAPTKIRRVFDHGTLVSEVLADPPPAPTTKDATNKEEISNKEALCKKTPFLCMDHVFDSAPFLSGAGAPHL